MLHKYGGNMYCENEEHKTPLHDAVDKKRISTVKCFVGELKMDISKFDEDYKKEIKEMLGGSLPDNQTGSPDTQVTEQERKAYRLALKHGLAKSATFRLLVFGPENSGKTCLIGTLFNEPFQENAATKGADVHICTIYAANWCKCSAKEMAEKLQIKFCKNLNIAAKKQVDPMSVARPSSDPSKPAASVNVQSSAKIPEVKIEEIKHAKAIKITSEEEFTAVVWDCAGQEKYITTHTFFVRRNNLVFIVFKASCNLFGPIEARRGDHQSSPKVTHFKVIHYWLQTVTSVRHETGGAAHMSEFLPTVVLVVTHIDEIIGGIEEAKDAIITQLAEELKGKPYAKHLIGNRDGKGLLEALKEFCIFLSNKSEFRDPETIARLKKIVQQASAPILEEKHPLVYIKIEKSLLSLQKEVITTTEFHEVAKDNGFLADKDSPEIMGALDHFHQMGIILHFPSIDELKELVFLSPQWLEKLFAYLIIAHPYKISGDNKDHLYECLVQDGILFGTFLKHMLQMFNKAQEVTGCNISFEQAVAFLAKFRFIAEISISTNFLEQSHPRLQCEENTEIFIVPSQLSEYKREVRSSFVQKTDVWSLHFIFSDGFVPSTIFYQVVAACITWNTKRSQPISRLKCHEIMMVLDEGQYYGVSLCEESVSIQLDIILDKSIGIPSCEHRKQLIDFFESVLLQVCKELIPASPKPKMRIPCPFCHKPHVKYDAKPDELLCREQERMVPKKYYQNLLTYEGTDGDGDECTTGQEERDRVTLPGLLEHLNDVVHWDKFGVYLLPTEYSVEIQSIRKAYKGDVDECKMALFQKYMEVGDRSWTTVITALKKSGYKNIAKDTARSLGLKEKDQLATDQRRGQCVQS